MLDWEEMRYLLAASRAGSLAGAARSLRVDQSTVSRRLARLERVLGARLFDRSRNGLSLSALGRQLVPSLEEMERAALEMERRASGEDARVAGVVRVATTEAFAAEVIVPHLPFFSERFPGVDVELLTGNEVVDLSRREADVSIRAVRPTEPSLVARKVGEISLAVYASDAYLRRLGQPDPSTGFRGHQFIGYTASAQRWPEAIWVARNAAAARSTIRLSSIPARVAAAAVGLGLALLPCFLGDAEPTLRRVLPPDPQLQREVWVVVHRDLQRNARVRAFLEVLLERLERDAPRLRGNPESSRRSPRTSRT